MSNESSQVNRETAGGVDALLKSLAPQVTPGEHENSEGERISIDRTILNGQPALCLVIHDDPPPYGSGMPAPMLLDNGTRLWLLEKLSEGTVYP